MSSDIATIDLHTETAERYSSASGTWEIGPRNRVEMPRLPARFIQMAGIALAIAVPPATAAPDYWFLEKRRRGESTVSFIVEGVIGRRLTRAEALQIARGILEQAERERLELAGREAARGIQWEAGE